MEILYKKLAFIETLLKKDLDISTHDELFHLATKLAIQIKSMEVACDNLDATLKIMLQVHKSFLEKYTLIV